MKGALHSGRVGALRPSRITCQRIYHSVAEIWRVMLICNRGRRSHIRENLRAVMTSSSRPHDALAPKPRLMHRAERLDPQVSACNISGASAAICDL